MKLDVLIQREGSRRLRARVLQQGQLGSDLLRGRSLTQVDAAKEAATHALYRKLGYATALEIAWTVKG